jgi:hypothetical protein
VRRQYADLDGHFMYPGLPTSATVSAPASTV